MTNRQARIKRLKEAFQKVEQLMNDGYVVQWDGDVVERIILGHGVELEHSVGCYSGVYEDAGVYEDMADLMIAEINKELSERLSVWKRVEIAL